MSDPESPSGDSREILEPEPFEVTKLQYNTISWLYSRRREIDMDPTYQRQGAVWTVEKQRLLIDSLLNRFDVPKIYLHKFARPRRENGKTVRWALVDGKQRLEAIFGFMDGEFALGKEFVLLEDGSSGAAGATYNELKDSYPDLVAQFQATQLELMEIRTEDLELVEEMFSRLNEAVPLNAAEKRNALGGPVPPVIRELVVGQPFFTQKLPFSNRRYRHYDLAVKFLYWARAEETDSHVRDTKKLRLDGYVRDMKQSSTGEQAVQTDRATAEAVLETMASIFVDEDRLLTSVGMVSIYYLLALQANEAETLRFPPRLLLTEFEASRRVSKRREEDLTRADLVFLEFQRLSQSPNDGAALSYRLEVLRTWCSAKESGADANEAVALLYDQIDDAGA